MKYTLKIEVNPSILDMLVKDLIRDNLCFTANVNTTNFSDVSTKFATIDMVPKIDPEELYKIIDTYFINNF